MARRLPALLLTMLICLCAFGCDAETPPETPTQEPSPFTLSPESENVADSALSGLWEQTSSPPPDTPSPVPAQSIELSHTELELHRENSFALSATVYPADAADKTLVWTSSNSAVLSVDEQGLVTALAAGKAAVTVACGDVYAHCNVTVTVELRKLSLMLSQYAAHLGESITADIAFSPADADAVGYRLTCSDESVLQPDGELRWKAVGVGKCTLTATTENGLSDSAEVEVHPVISALGYVQPELRLGVGQVQTPALMITPGDIELTQLRFESSAPDIVNVGPEGELTALTPGTAVISVSEEGGLRSECRVTVAVLVEELTVSGLLDSYLVGESADFTVDIHPADATEPALDIRLEEGAESAFLDGHTLSFIAAGQVVLRVTCADATVTKRIQIIDLQAYAAELVQLVNTQRLERGLPELTAGYEALDAVAQLRAEELTVLFGSERPGGGSLSDALTEAEIPHQTVGESLSRGFMTPQAAFNAFSSYHADYEQMGSELYTHVSAAVTLTEDGTLIWLLVYAGLNG